MNLPQGPDVIQLGCYRAHKAFKTDCGGVTHICIGKLNIIGSDNDLSSGRHQAIIWTIAGILSIEALETEYSEILTEIHFLFKKMYLKMSSGKWWPFCLDLNVSKYFCHYKYDVFNDYKYDVFKHIKHKGLSLLVCG